MNNKETSETQYSTYNKIELKSTEVQELMGRMPSSVIRMGQGIILLTLVLFCSVGLFWDYPKYTIVSSEISNVNSLTLLYAKDNGWVHSVNFNYGSKVKAGDTLCVIKKDSFQQYVLTQEDGLVFTSEMSEGTFINKNTCLAAIADTLYKLPFSTIHISIEQSKHLQIGKTVEGLWEHGSIKGIIEEVSKYPNPQTGKYSVRITWNQLDLNPQHPIHRKKINVKIHLHNTKLWKVLFHL